MLGISIGRLSKATGVPVETVRFYEKIGLLSAPPRASSGFRRYRLDTVQELAFIRDCREVGFSLPEIRELLQVKDALYPEATRRLALEHSLRSLETKFQSLRACQNVLERELTGPCVPHDVGSKSVARRQPTLNTEARLCIGDCACRL